MGGLRVDLAAEVLELLAQRSPELKTFGYLEGLGVERNLQGRHEIELRYVVGASSARAGDLLPAVDGDGRELQPPRLQQVGDRHPDAGLVHYQLDSGLGGAAPRRVVLVPIKGF